MNGYYAQPGMNPQMQHMGGMAGPGMMGMPMNGQMGMGPMMGNQGMGMGMPMQMQMPMNGMMGGGAPGMGMQPGMGMGQGMAGMGMPQPGYGAMGMPGAMAYQGQQMGGMGPNGLQMGMIPMGGGHPGIGESQAAPGMHPYSYGAQSGVAWGNQPIDQMGNATYPGGGQQRGYYGYGQQRYY